MSPTRLIAKLVELGAAPVLVIMAAVTAAGAHYDDVVASMWLMYAIMALLHSGPWLRRGRDEAE